MGRFEELKKRVERLEMKHCKVPLSFDELVKRGLLIRPEPEKITVTLDACFTETPDGKKYLFDELMEKLNSLEVELGIHKCGYVIKDDEIAKLKAENARLEGIIADNLRGEDYEPEYKYYYLAKQPLDNCLGVVDFNGKFYEFKK